MNKKWVFVIVMLLVVAAILSRYFWLKRKSPELHISEEKVSVEGLKKEYRLFFVSDSHISLADERDTDEVQEKAKQRHESILYEGYASEQYFDALVKEAGKRKSDLLILGGDIVDSAMYASLDHVKNTLDHQNVPYLFYSGNHDFEYGDEYYSEKAYSEYLPRLEELNHTQSYQVTEYDDLIIFTADDDMNMITADALEALKTVCSKGKPVVLCVHVPFEPQTEDDSLLTIARQFWGDSAEGHAKVLLYPNPTTEEFMNLVFDEHSPVVLVLAGHIHFYHKDMLNDKTLQIVSGAAYEGNALEITLTPAE